MKPGFIYIITNKNHTVLYTGVTSNLPNRIIEHLEKHHPDSFSAKYNVNKLVYYEQFQMIGDAIGREKQIKASPLVRFEISIFDFNNDKSLRRFLIVI